LFIISKYFRITFVTKCHVSNTCVQTHLPLNIDNVITKAELLNTYVQSRILIICAQGKLPSGKAMKCNIV
jgi:hypothetical protein